MSKSHRIDMTDGSIFCKLLLFSIPLIFSSILQLLFNAVDIVVVGKFAGDNALAAVGSTGSLINLIINLFMGLSIGTNVVAANYYGAKETEKLKQTVHTSMVLSLIAGLILTFTGVVFTKPILILMKAPAEVLDLAAVYLRIYFGGITASMIYNFGSALLRSKGDTLRPLIILFCAGFINLLLNLLFVIVYHMNVAGVAYATIISQTISALVVVFILIKENDEYHLNLKELKITPYILGRIIKIGVPAGFQGIMFSFSNVIIQSSINSFGAIMIAGSSAASNLEGFIYTSMNGFSQGCLTFCSQNLGAKRMDRIKKVVFVGQFYIILISFIEGLLFMHFSTNLLGLYTRNPEVIEAGYIRLKVIVLSYFLCGLMDAMANIIRGCGHSLLPAIVTIFGVCVLRIVWLGTAFQIPAFHNPTTIFLSYPISWIVTYLVHIICFVVIFKKIK